MWPLRIISVSSPVHLHISAPNPSKYWVYREHVIFRSILCSRWQGRRFRSTLKTFTESIQNGVWKCKFARPPRRRDEHRQFRWVLIDGSGYGVFFCQVSSRTISAVRPMLLCQNYLFLHAHGLISTRRTDVNDAWQHPSLNCGLYAGHVFHIVFVRAEEKGEKGLSRSKA